MTDTWMERYVHKYGNHAVYQELLEEFKAASDELFQFPKQLTPEQIEVLNRYLVAFCRLERYQNLLERREAGW